MNLNADTIRLHLPCEALPKETLDTLPSLLTNIKETHDRHTGNVSIKGNLDNLTIWQSSYAVTVEGSLTKYRYGNNWEGLPFGEMLRTFDSLSDRLYMPLDEAVITRLDLGINMIMDYHESLYFGLLDHCPKYSKMPCDNGIYFNQGQKQMLFYGKEREQKAKGQLIPVQYQNKHTLRYEMRWRKGLSKQFNTGPFRVHSLCQEGVYMDLISKMSKEYLKIKKQRINSIAIDSMSSLKANEDYITLVGLQAVYGSLGNALAYIDKANKSGVFKNKMQARRLKDKYKRLYENPKLTKQNDLAIELDSKVKEALNEC